MRGAARTAGAKVRCQTQHAGDKSVDQVKQGSDALFILLGAIMVLAMHAGFAFLELEIGRAHV